MTQQLSKRQIEEINRQGFGGEPAPADLLDTAALIRTLNWYSALKERSDAKQYLIDYAMKHDPANVRAIETLAESDVDCTMGWIARLICRESVVPNKDHLKLHGYLSQVAKRRKPVSNRLANEESSPAFRDGKYDQLLISVEEAVDRFDETFSCYDMLVSAGTAHRIAGRIADYYQPQLNDLKAAVEKTDKQCMEAYSHLKYSELCKFYAFIQSIVEDARRFKDNLIKARKPKKNSANKPKDVLKHFKYQEKDDGLKISSINPLSIIGAKELYVYNTARKMLTMFKAKEGGLKISRSSINNFDQEQSVCKRVSGRNFSNLVKQIENSNAKGRAKALQAIDTGVTPISDRISSNVVLLRALK